MKKVILFAAILFAGVSMANAQSVSNEVEEQGSDQTILKIVLANIQYIEVLTNSSIGGDNVLISYDNIEAYAAEATSSTVQDHLRLTAVGPFSVSVKAENNLTLTTPVAETLASNQEILASDIKFSATQGLEALSNASYTTRGALSKDESVTVVTSTTGGMNKTISMEYIATGDYSEYYAGGTENPYTTTLTYTITPN